MGMQLIGNNVDKGVRSLLQENVNQKRMSPDSTLIINFSIFYGIWIKQSLAMVFIFNLDKLSLKTLFPTMNI